MAQWKAKYRITTVSDIDAKPTTKIFTSRDGDKGADAVWEGILKASRRGAYLFGVFAAINPETGDVASILERLP